MSPFLHLAPTPTLIWHSIHYDCSRFPSDRSDPTDLTDKLRRFFKKKKGLHMQALFFGALELFRSGISDQHCSSRP